MLRMEIGGVWFDLDPAAISALRYRAEYGDSIVNHLAASTTLQEAEGRLLRMCRMMIPAADRPELPDFTELAGRDPAFMSKAITAKNALLNVDGRLSMEDREAQDGEPFDEYDILVMLAAAHMDAALIYELPIMHLAGIAGRYFALQDPERKSYRKMTSTEMTAMYPR